MRVQISIVVFLFAVGASACAPAAPAPNLTPSRSERTQASSPIATSAPPKAQATASPSVVSTRSVGSSAATSVSDLNLRGQFVFTSDDGTLWIQDAKSGNRRTLYKPTSNEYAGFPAFSHDGKQVAFSVNSFTKDGQAKNDVRVISIDGTNEKVIVASDDPKVGLDFPTWSPDDKEIYLTHTLFVPPSSERDEIDRVSARGGALIKVVDDSIEPNISSDGKKMTFQRVDPKTFSASLWIANLDGSGAKRIMEAGTFAAIFGARFSPDSQTLVFAASGPPNKKLPGAAQLQTPANDCSLSILFACLVGTAEAHGLPWDLWLVNLDGTKYERLTNIGADSPVPAWSQDGKYIAYFEATGIYVVDREKKKIYPVSDRGGYGGFDWH